MRGRIASLLEVGTGFHPELTGRENVYLNGMLLGMSSQQVSNVFEAICDFAAIGPYINVPIKRYSSGMQLRLAFAVAAHLSADTMIVDEVLAVGDAEFQRKCLGAMRDVSRAGRTTIFVSHNMSAIEALCSRVIWLEAGAVKNSGSPGEIVREYLASSLVQVERALEHVDLREFPRTAWTIGMGRLMGLRFLRVTCASDRGPWRVAFGEPFGVEVEFQLDRHIPELVVGIALRNDRGEDVLTSHSSDIAGEHLASHASSGTATVQISQPWLRPGSYLVEAVLISGAQYLDCVIDVATLIVEEQSADEAPSLMLKKGVVAPVWPWKFV
jgi:hypothetical protein